MRIKGQNMLVTLIDNPLIMSILSIDKFG
jgi:hypothetical protein